MATKLAIEGTLAIVFGVILTFVIVEFGIINQIENLSSAQTVLGIRILTTITIYYQFTYCEYTSQLESGSETPQSGDDQNEESSEGKSESEKSEPENS